MTKWIVLCAGVAIQMVLGGVYAWSEFVPPLNELYGISKSQCGLIFGVTILTFTLVMIPAGRILQRHGPRITAGTGAILFCAGYWIASLSQGNFLMLLLGIGLITGTGIGLGYICPLTVAMKWFPDNKGLVTGVAVAGFGGGAVIVSAVAKYLLVDTGMDVLQAFQYIGLGSGVIAFTSAMFLSQPEETGNTVGQTETAPSVRSILLSKDYLLICLGMFCGTFAGLLVVGNLKPMAQSLGLSGGAATLCISLFAIGNAVGRISWGQIHDRIGNRPSIVYSLAFLGLSLMPLLLTTHSTALLVTIFLIGFGFGGCFVIYASSIVNLYGMDLFPRLYPVCFVGYGLAALIGPTVGGLIADIFGGYGPAIILSAGIALAAAPFIWTASRRASEPLEA